MDSEAYEFIFAVLFFWWSRSFGPRGTKLFLTVDHSLTSRLWAFCEFAADTLKKILCVHKSCHSPVEKFPASKFIEVCPSIHLVEQVLEERALAWSSPFRLAKMVPIWPQKSCISPGLAGNCDLPFKWPVPCPPRCSSKVGSSEKALYYIEPSQ